MSDQRVCEHGSLARKCELCERDETIAHLSSRLTAAECSLNQRYALRRELEAALGITSEMASDAALRAGLDAVRRLITERDEQKRRGDLALEQTLRHIHEKDALDAALAAAEQRTGELSARLGAAQYERAEAQNKLAATPVSLAESHELADILHTLTNSGTALITSARELVAVYEKTKAALAAERARADHATKLALELEGHLGRVTEKLAALREEQATDAWHTGWQEAMRRMKAAETIAADAKTQNERLVSALADERERCEAIERHRDHVHEQWQAERARLTHLVVAGERLAFSERWLDLAAQWESSDKVTPIQGTFLAALRDAKGGGK